MRRILLIAYSFPPSEDPQSLRWFYYTRELTKYDFSVDVLTIDYPLETSLDLSKLKNVKIYRIFPGVLQYLAVKFKKKTGSDRAFISKNIRQKISWRLLKKGYNIIKGLYNYLLPGDYRTEFFIHALYFLEKLNRESKLSNKYDLVITSHEPAVDTYIGFFLKNRFGLRWIADFGDPYVCIYTPRLKLFFEHILEKKIYRSADALIFTNYSLVDYLLSKYYFLKEKPILVLYQGFDLSLLEENISGLSKENKQLFPLDTEALNLFYSGTFYKSFRNPLTLIESLCELNSEGYKIHLYIAGRNDAFQSIFEKYDFIKYFGFIDHKTIVTSYRNFDVLICLLNDTKYQIPGKFFEYLGTKKMILCMGYEHEELINITKNMTQCIFIDYKKNFIKEQLKKLYEMKLSNRLNNLFYSNEINKYSYQEQAKKLIDFLKKLSQ